MDSRCLFPYALTVCFGLALTLSPVNAQSANTENASQLTRLRVTSVTTRGGNSTPTLENDIVIISEAQPTAKTYTATDAPKIDLLKDLTNPLDAHIDQMLLAAIENRIGAPYVWGASGPRVFDCSGFIWSVYRSAGVEFERTNARTFWSRFAPADGANRYRFGTLVFFKNLTHVGIVADERGFYHASSSHGVTYSTFDDYWTSRIDGFRYIPTQTFLASAR